MGVQGGPILEKNVTLSYNAVSASFHSVYAAIVVRQMTALTALIEANNKYGNLYAISLRQRRATLVQTKVPELMWTIITRSIIWVRHCAAGNVAVLENTK